MKVVGEEDRQRPSAGALVSSFICVAQRLARANGCRGLPRTSLTRIKPALRRSRSVNRMSFAPSKKLFSATRTKRNTAFVMLLVWLFALASRVANAGLLATPEWQSNAASAALPETSHATAELVGGDSDTIPRLRSGPANRCREKLVGPRLP